VWYDPSAVSTRNDRAADADAGFDKYAVSYEAWRNAHGFSESDAPSETELALRLMVQKGMITPELTEAMLAAFAPEAMQAVKQAGQAASVAPIPAEVQQALDNSTEPTQEQVDIASEEPPIELAEPSGAPSTEGEAQ
jgi:hypothetical protein